VSDPSRLPEPHPLTSLHRPAPTPGFGGADVDGTAALAPVPRRPIDPTAGRTPALRVVPPLPAPPKAPLPPPPVTLVLRGLLEVLSGWRPAAQLVPRTSPEIASDLLSRRRPRVAGRPPSVARLRTLRVSDDVVEACAVLRREQRCGALAMRFEYSERGWLLTRLEVG
jgi:Family of unknown function (DUF6459)